MRRRRWTPFLALLLGLALSGQGGCNQDTDGDGVPDAQDNCPEVQNPFQTDDDGDRIGDACDILRSCTQIKELTTDVRPPLEDGIYTIDPDGDDGVQEPFRVYCDLTTDGGGWTLVWSNLRGGTHKPVTNLGWEMAISTEPRFNGTLGPDLEAFNYYLGLEHWERLGDEIRYDWANDYGSPIDQRFYADYDLDAEGGEYNLQLTNYREKIGNTTAGLWSYHNGSPFSTYDHDNDAVDGGNCATFYTNTPWWYRSCWSGSINGGGEGNGNGYFNGAYWVNSARSWGDDNGNGAGNGWIFVRFVPR